MEVQRGLVIPQRNYTRMNIQQSCQKALAMDHVVSWSNPGEIILDPHMGSGHCSKGSEALRAPRNWYRDRRTFCEIAAKQMEQEVFNFGQ